MRAEILASSARDSHSDGDEVPDEHPQAENELRARLAVVERELSLQTRALEVAYSSHSWKLTAPVRAAAQRIRARRRQRA
jgi:hypothetical protein